MQRQRHEKADVHGTRLITAALVLIVGALSLAAVTPLVEHSPTGRSTHARQDEHSPWDGSRKDGGPLVRPDVVAPRLSVPDAVRVRARRSTGRIVRYRAAAVDATDGVLTTSCAPRSGTWFAAGRTAVSCSATDRAGNVARAGFAVHVRNVDVTPPRLRLPGQIGRIAHDPSGVIVRYASTAIDRRDGRVAARCLPASGSRFHPGITAVRCTAADRAGNVARGGFVVVVRTMPGSMPPLLCFPGDPCDATREYAAWRFDR